MGVCGGVERSVLMKYEHHVTLFYGIVWLQRLTSHLSRLYIFQMKGKKIYMFHLLHTSMLVIKRKICEGNIVQAKSVIDIGDIDND